VNEVADALFASGHYGQAIFEAYKLVEKVVKDKTGSDKIGKALMAETFNPKAPRIKLNELKSQTDQDEQEGFMHLFMGGMQGIRNPKGHSLSKETNRLRTIEYLALASLLVKRVEAGQLVPPHEPEPKDGTADLSKDGRPIAGPAHETNRGRFPLDSSKTLAEIGIAQAREKQRLENQQKWQDLYREHSKMIGKTIFEGWKNNSGVLASWNYQLGQFTSSDPREADMDYVHQAKSHLQQGYPSIWESYKQFLAKSEETRNSARTWVQSFEALVKEKIESSCSGIEVLQGGASHPYPARASYLRTILGVVFFQIQLQRSGRPYGVFNIGDLTTDIAGEGDLIMRRTVKNLSFGGESLGHGEMMDMQKLQQCVKDLMSDKLAQEYVRQCDVLQEQLKDFSGSLDKEVRNILSRVLAGEQLKGSCDLCPANPAL
jgi:uncharacterized protein (TIGR02391 family)